MKTYLIGDHAGVTYTATQENRIFVQRYVNLVTNRVQEIGLLYKIHQLKLSFLEILIRQVVYLPKKFQKAIF